MRAPCIGQERSDRRYPAVLRALPALAVLAATLASGPHVPAAFDREGAKATFAQAAERERTLRLLPPEQRKKTEYANVISAYIKVPLLSPAVGECDDALYRASVLRCEGGKLFSQPFWIEKAVESLEWLLKEYPHSPLQREAMRLKFEILSTELGRNMDAVAVGEEYLRRWKAHPSSREIAKSLKSLKTTVAAAAAPIPDKWARLLNVRFWSTTDYTRVILDFDGRVSYTHDAAYEPYRIFFDFSDAALAPDVKERITPEDDIYLNSIRAAAYKPGVVRVVLDFKKPGSYTVFTLPNTNSVVIDIRDPDQSAMVKERRKRLAQVFQTPPGPRESITESDLPPVRPAAPSSRPVAETAALQPVPAKTPETVAAPSRPEGAAAPTAAGTAPGKGSESTPAGEGAVTAPPAKSAAEAPVPPAETASAEAARDDEEEGAPPTAVSLASLSRVMRLKIGKIVLDPGHGGKDHGSTGYGGIREKDVVLSIARELKRQIEASLGIEVALTRDNDTFIPLEQRTAKVNTEKADLFISLHANSSRDRQAGGFETFYLGFSKDRAALLLAAYENATTEKSLGDLSDVIRKITQYEKMKESKMFARKVNRRLFSLLRKSDPAARDRGVKTAPFVVLIGTNVPSILVETGFISNRREADFISRPENQVLIAGAIVEGIRSYLADFDVKAKNE